MVKKLLALLFAVCLAVCMGSVPAFAALEPYDITYNIHSGNENDIIANTGDIITVTFEMTRTDGDDPTYFLNSYQNEIEYDMNFFRLDESSVQMTFPVASGAKIVDTRISGQTIIKAANTQVTHSKDNHVICTFDLEVIGTHGTGTVRTSKGKCSAWDDGITPPKAVKNNITEKNLTVTIDASSIVPVQDITLSPSSATLVAVGETLTLSTVITPDNASDKSVVYSSSDENVATVNNSGIVTAVANGSAVITVTTTDGGKTATCAVTVDIPPATVSVTGVTLSPETKTLEIGQTVQLVATVLPADATDKTVTYTSSKPSVATVDSTGLVTAMVAGQTTITVTTVDGGKTATAVITVNSSGGGVIGGGGSIAPEKFTLSFDTNGGMEITGIEAVKGTTISLDKYVTDKPGFKFEGWYSDAEFTNKITEIVLKKDIKIYAKWIPVEEEGKEDDGKDEPVVDKSDYKPAILTEQRYAYIVGRENDMVAPESDITRAEVATIIYRLLKEDERNKAKTDENIFSDVNESDWFNTAVSTLASLKLVNGRTTETFEPNAPITRAELATIFARMIEIEYDGEVLFSDVSRHWAESYINEAATAKWIVGYNGLFRPDDNITRAEVMTLVNRVLNREPKNKADLPENMKTWIDNADENAWYYLAVQEATNNHDITSNLDWTNIAG